MRTLWILAVVGLLVVGYVPETNVAFAKERVSASKLKRMLVYEEDLEVLHSSEIRLVSGERALLIACELPEEIRAEEYRVVLYRPKLGEAKFVEGEDTFKLVTLDKTKAPIIELSNSFMVHGHLSGSITLVRFDGWEEKVLLRKKFEENGGAYEPNDDEYKSTDVSFEYRDLDGDGVSEVIVRIRETKGTRERTFTEQYRYFRGKLRLIK